MKMVKKLTKIFSLIFLSISIYSCDSGCVNEDEFDGYSVEVNSKPESTGIIGTYNSVDGGQIANWQNTGLRSNGEQFIIQVTGAWTPWYGAQTNYNSLNNLEKCTFCAKKEGVANCLCYDNQNPEPELSANGYTLVNTDCSIAVNQDDPAKCTCTRSHGSANDYNTYHIPLNYMDKYENIKDADNQSNCKYYGGMGLYVGLFGRSGNDNPARIYHLFSQTEVCDVVRDANGKCLDDNGKDVTKYIYRSPHNTIFVKDDNKGNNTNDDSNATYHSPYEQVKLTINDGYYSDNYGKYNVSFYNGVGSTNKSGILEYLVSLVENSLLGDIGEDGKREGGIIRFMYQSIVQDSGFILIIQILLTMYISFYGLAILIGVADITTKELMNRLLKFALIIFFTSSDSWNWYNDIVVQFFKGGMDAIIGRIMDLSDQNFNSQTSSIIISQMDRASDLSNSTRFSYIDLTIEKLLSFATAKKIFGLFFGTFFGFIYIFLIYALIAYFIYAMLNAVLVYVINLMKLIFILALGPIFICFTLFAQTNGIFKKWLLFLSARSLEMVMMFLILYNFIVLINNQFVSMLYYKSCVESYNLYLFSLKILKADTNRALTGWFSYFIMIGGLIFMLQLVFDKVALIAGNIISVGGETNVDADGVGRGQSNFNMAGKMLGNAFSFAESNLKSGLYSGAGLVAKGADYVGYGVSRATNAVGGKILRTDFGQVVANSSFGKAVGKVYDNIPGGPRTFYRNRLIDAEIASAKKDILKSSPSISGAELDLKVRERVVKAMNIKMYHGQNPKGKTVHDPMTMSIAGINTESILKRLDEKLVQEPLKNFLKDTAKKLKASENVPLGNQMQESLKEAAKSWANKNLSGGEASVEKHLKDMNSFIKKQANFTTSEAAKVFGDSIEGQNRYLQYLKENEFIKKQKADQAKKGIFGGEAYKVGEAFTKLYSRDHKLNPEVAREVFLRKIDKQEAKKEAAQKYATKLEVAKDYSPLAKAAKHVKEYLNPFNLDVKNIRDRATGDFVVPNYISKQSKEVRDAALSSTRESLRGLNEEKISIEKKFQDKINPQNSKTKGFVSDFNKKEAEKEKDKSLKELNDKKEFFASQLKKYALKKDDFVNKLQELQKLRKGKDLNSIESYEKLRQKMFFDAQLAVDQAKKEIKEKEERLKYLNDEQNRKNADLKKYVESFAKLQKLQKEVLDKTTDEDAKKEMKSKILEEGKKYEDIKRREEELIASLKSQREEILKSVGGEDLLKEGLSKIKGTTLIEEEQRLEYIEDLIKKENTEFVELQTQIAKDFDKTKSDIERMENEMSLLSEKAVYREGLVNDLDKRGDYLNERRNKLSKEEAKSENIENQISINQELKNKAQKKLESSRKDLAKLQSKIDQSAKKFDSKKSKKLQKDLEEEIKESAALEVEDIVVERKVLDERSSLQARYNAKKFDSSGIDDEIIKLSEEISRFGNQKEIEDKINILEQSASVYESKKKQIEKEISAKNSEYQESIKKLNKITSSEEMQERIYMQQLLDMHKNHNNPFQLDEDLQEFKIKNKGSEKYTSMSSEELGKSLSEYDEKLKKQQDELANIVKEAKELLDSKFEQERISKSIQVQISVAKQGKSSLGLKELYKKDIAKLKELQKQMEDLKKAQDLPTVKEKKDLVEQRKELSRLIIEAEEKVYKYQLDIEVDKEKSEISNKKVESNERLQILNIVSEEYKEFAISKQEELVSLQKERQEKYDQFAKLSVDKSNPANEETIKVLVREISDIESQASKVMIEQEIHQKSSLIAIQEMILENSKLELLDFREKTAGRDLTKEERIEENLRSQNVEYSKSIIEASKVELAQYKATIYNEVIKEIENIIQLGLHEDQRTKEAVEDKSKQLKNVIEALEDNKLKALENSHSFESDKKDNSKKEDRIKESNKYNYAEKSSLFSDKMQVNAKLKLAQLDILMKKSELDRLKSTKPENITSADQQKIANLEKEISILESNLKGNEDKSRKIDNKISLVDS